jgi:hypothetical protein
MTPHRRRLQQVRHLGQYTSDAETERILHTVLAALPPPHRRRTPQPRRNPAGPDPHRLHLPEPRAPTSPAPVEALAHTLDTSPTSARWDASSVLATMADEDRVDRLLTHPPCGYALLFG